MGTSRGSPAVLLIVRRPHCHLLRQGCFETEAQLLEVANFSPSKANHEEATPKEVARTSQQVALVAQTGQAQHF